MDEHVKREITDGLHRRGIDVLTAQEDHAGGTPDPQLLDRATFLDRVLFSQDEDFLSEAARRQRSGEDFPGVVFARQLDVTIGSCISDLELIAGAMEPDELRGRVIYLPLK
jgi:predicted nuclease of predicted toxin-antitoxin system